MSQTIATTHPNTDTLIAPLPGNSSISPQWLESVLHQRSIISPNTTVESVELTDLSENRGLSGSMKRLIISYANTEDSFPNLKTLVMKRSTDSEEGRKTCLSYKQYREAQFYASDLVAKVPFGPSSHVLYAYGNGEIGEYVILMKDLAKPMTIGVNMVFGNQIWGRPTFDFELPQPLDVLENMFRMAAKCHATFWNDQDLLNHKFLKGALFYAGQNKEQFEKAIQISKDGWMACKKRNSESTLFKFSPKLVEIIEKSLDKPSWDVLQQELTSEPFTLCHGDFHASNMIINVESGDITMLDWSEIGVWNPTTDLAQTMISDLNPELFVHSKDMVKKYWDELIRNGISESEFPFEKCWQSFCKNGPERWIWFLIILAQMPALSDVGIKYFHDQLLSFIEAHGDYEYYILKSLI